MNIFKLIKIVSAAFSLAVVLTACGGGSGGGTATPAATIISGTAAAGAPIVGYVSVRDSSTNAQPVKTSIPIAADGKYSVDVSGLTAPFTFLADGTVGGKRVQLYSAATQADVNGTISITPFTDLMLRNAAGTLAGVLVDAYITNGTYKSLTAVQLNFERDKLTTQLAPVLTAAGLSTTIDLLRTAFTANNTGIDRFMDLVKVDTTIPTAVTITNILDATRPLTINPITGTTTGGNTLSATGVTATPTPVDLIVQQLNTFSTFFATTLPSPADQNLLALFSSTFKDDGQSSSVFLTDITTTPNVVGLKFANVVVDSVDTVAGIAQIHFRPLNSTGASLANDMPGGAIAWQMKFEGGVWKAHGNQRIAHVNIRAFADRWICNFGSGCSVATIPTYTTGLNLSIDNRTMAAIGSALVTGPGLPSAGQTLTAQANQTWFGFPVPCGNGCTNTSNKLNMVDSTITGMGPGPYTYTVSLYSTSVPSGTALATYTQVVPAAPTLNAALPNLAFPSLSNMTNLANYPGGNLNLSWTIPAGLTGDNLTVDVWQNGTTAPNQFVMGDLQTKTATSGTSTLVITAPSSGTWTSGNYGISTWDTNLGKVESFYQ